jgi:hypothetical protein
MMKLKISFLVLIILWSCGGPGKINEEFSQRLNKADMIEFKNGDNSARYVNPEILKSLKEILIPTEVSACKSSDNHEFPLSILLYSNSEVIGEIGVEAGDTRYLHYKVNETYYGKSELKYQLGMFIDDIQF